MVVSELHGVYLPNLGVQIPHQSPVPLPWLIALLPTEAYERRREELGRLPANKVTRATRVELGRIDAFLERCKVRDAIQASRPQGCWCLGYGHRPSRSKVCPDSPTSNAISDYLEFCECRDGQQAYRHYEVMRQRTISNLANERVERHWGSAGIPAVYENVDLNLLEVDDIDQDNLEEVKSWVEKQSKSSIFLFGQHGVGKTTMAVAALKECLKAGRNGLFSSVGMLIDRLREDERDVGNESNVLSSLIDLDVLVLDDLGRARPTAFALDRFFLLLDQRQMWKRPTIFTSNF